MQSGHDQDVTWHSGSPLCVPAQPTPPPSTRRKRRSGGDSVSPISSSRV
jgi:hypothetical protein